MPLYKVASQLYSDSEAQLKGAKQILDDCTWSSCAAAIGWSSNYQVSPTAAEAVIAMKKVTGRKDVQGVSDNGGSLAEAVKVIAHFGGKARYAKSWDDAVAAAKSGAALMVWVQQPVAYPAGVKISAWHDRWFKWWSKHSPEKIRLGYGHMTSGGWCEDHGFQWACPTRDTKVAAEKYGVPVSEEQLRQIANSKVKAGKLKADFKALLIVTHPSRKIAAPAPAPVAPTTPISATQSAVIVAPVAAPVPVKKAPEIDPALSAAVAGLERVDWGAKAGQAADAIGHAVESTKGQSGMNRVFGIIKAIKDSTGLDEAILEASRVFLSTCIAMMLATGSPLLDMSTGDFKVVVSGGLAAALNVVVRFLNPNDSQFGVKTKGN